LSISLYRAGSARNLIVFHRGIRRINWILMNYPERTLFESRPDTISRFSLLLFFFKSEGFYEPNTEKDKIPAFL